MFRRFTQMLFNISFFVFMVALASACSSGSPQTVEVTRIVPQTVVIPQTVIVPQTIVVTKQIESTRLVLVTQEVQIATTTPTPNESSFLSIDMSSRPPVQIYPKPANALASIFVGGDSSPILPAGDQGNISVIAFLNDKNMGFSYLAIRNNTDTNIVNVKVSAIASDKNGNMIANGDTYVLHPNYLRPGDIAFGMLDLGMGTVLPSDATLEYKTSYEAPNSSAFFRILDLEVVSVDLVENRVVGELKNPYQQTVTGPIEVVLACFDTNGDLLDVNRDYTSQDTVTSGDTIPFQFDFVDDCPVPLVAGSGYEK